MGRAIRELGANLVESRRSANNAVFSCYRLFDKLGSTPRSLHAPNPAPNRQQLDPAMALANLGRRGIVLTGVLPVKILVASSEASPFAKTGGLGDVTAALPAELARLGVEVSVILPAFRQAFECGEPIESLGIQVEIPIGSKRVVGEILRSYLPGTRVPVYLIAQDRYYDRPGLYQQNGEDYIDNCERFVFFSRAVMESIRLLNLQTDLLHCNDWATGLIPAYQATEYRWVPGYEQLATLFTIHNLAYQGNFWHWDMVLTGLDWKYFNWQQMEFYGHLNLMKTGLVFADALSTVSPRYAREIQSDPQGAGLEGVLRDRGNVLAGILNGVDYQIWNPQIDPHLPAKYDAHNPVGKATCKAALQQELGMPIEADVPMVGMVGRLVDQKGLDLLATVVPQWLESSPLQWVFLGTGDVMYEQTLRRLAAQYPQKMFVHLGFSEALAHRIEAGVDMFIMPSLYEPCGLSQLYSLKYGAVPIVRATGGLADTIVDATPLALQAGVANGFSFTEYSAAALNRALRRACETFAQPEIWSQMVATGMSQDWSWQRSAQQYIELYRTTCQKVRQEVCT